MPFKIDSEAPAIRVKDYSAGGSALLSMEVIGRLHAHGALFPIPTGKCSPIRPLPDPARSPDQPPQKVAGRKSDNLAKWHGGISCIGDIKPNDFSSPCQNNQSVLKPAPIGITCSTLKYFATGKHGLAKSFSMQVLFRTGFARVLCQIATFSASSGMNDEQPI